MHELALKRIEVKASTATANATGRGTHDHKSKTPKLPLIVDGTVSCVAVKSRVWVSCVVVGSRA